MEGFPSLLRPSRHRVGRYLRTPKGRLLVLFGVLAAVGAPSGGWAVAATALAVGIATAAAVDVTLRRTLRGEWVAPTGAVLTGVDAAMVLSPFGSWFALPLACAIGVSAKHVLRTRTANVFNPSALGLVVVSASLGRGLNWWGSLPDSALPGLLLLILIGATVADHVNKLPLVLGFLATYFVSFDLLGLAIGHSQVAEVFDAPDTHAALFFAFFMLTDPPTSPVRYIDQLWYGPLVALLAVGIFALSGASYFLPGALLIGNVVEAARRVHQRRVRLRSTSVAPTRSRHDAPVLGGQPWPRLGIEPSMPDQVTVPRGRNWRVQRSTDGQTQRRSR